MSDTSLYSPESFARQRSGILTSDTVHDENGTYSISFWNGLHCWYSILYVWFCWHRHSSGGNLYKAERKTYKYNILSLLAYLFLLNWENTVSLETQRKADELCVPYGTSVKCVEKCDENSIFYSFILISFFSSSVHTNQITILMLQLINRTNLLKIDTIENVRVSCCSSGCSWGNFNLYANKCSNKSVCVSSAHSHTHTHEQEKKHPSDLFFRESVCVSVLLLWT